MKKNTNTVKSNSNSKVVVSLRIKKDKKNRIVRKANSMNITMTEWIMDSIDQTLSKDNQILREQLSGLIRNQKNLQDLFDLIQRDASKEDLMEAAKKILDEEVKIWHH